MSIIDPSKYSPVISELVRDERVNALGPGTPNSAFRPLLHGLTIEKAFAPLKPSDRDMATCCLAGLWLYHDFQDESHALSQEINTTSGSYWHGILHRREPDFGNSAYWFRRVGTHPVFKPLRAAAAELVAEAGGGFDVPSLWDPFRFIDFCEACVTGREPGEMLARRIQQREWELLFDYCYRQALGE